MTKFCFCISAFNEASSIKECIISAIEASRDFDARVLVLNNGSTDRTAEKVHSLQGDIDFDFVNFEPRDTYEPHLIG